MRPFGSSLQALFPIVPDPRPVLGKMAWREHDVRQLMLDNSQYGDMFNYIHNRFKEKFHAQHDIINPSTYPPIIQLHVFKYCFG